MNDFVAAITRWATAHPRQLNVLWLLATLVGVVACWVLISPFVAVILGVLNVVVVSVTWLGAKIASR